MIRVLEMENVIDVRDKKRKNFSNSTVETGRKPKSSKKQHALKGQKLLAQGIALGIIAISKAPCKGKSFIFCKM